MVTLSIYLTYSLDAPSLTHSIPESGISSGGFSIAVFGNNIPKPRENGQIICKFGNIFCQKTCDWISSTQLICTAQAHPPLKVPFSISYNRIDWHTFENDTKFSFSACETGYTASSYNNPCGLCTPGTYKPFDGLFDCIPCEADAYSSFSGSIKCEKCQDNTTTNGIQGSKSSDACVCKPGYFLNPKYDEHSNSHSKCIICPSGSFCPSINMSIPLAKPGFWRSDEDFTTFYACLPQVSCGGIGSNNCCKKFDFY